MRYVIILIACIIAVQAAACTQDQMIINSGDQKGVHSAMMCANLCRTSCQFIADNSHGTVLPNDLDKNSDIIFVEPKAGHGSHLQIVGTSMKYPVFWMVADVVG